MRPLLRACLLILSLWALLVLAMADPVLPAIAAGQPIARQRVPFLRESPKGYVCLRAARAPVIDGKLDDPAWANAPWTDVFVDIEGTVRPRPRHRTRAKMLWDDEFFYIAADLEEPHLWATLTRHDSVVFHDNDFEVFIDPDGDCHAYYEFEINALNTGWDLLLTRPYKDGGKALNAWEIPGLKKSVHLDGTLNDPRDRDRGWSVELAFPWKVLGEAAGVPSPPREGDQWRVNFSRVEWDLEVAEGGYRKVPGRPEYNWVWSPQGVINMHRPERRGYVQFTGRTADAPEFVPDPAGPARDVLVAVYDAQRAFREQHGKYAPTLADLGMQELRVPGTDVSPRLSVTDDLFQASVTIRLPGGGSQRWNIRQDARLWKS